MTTLAPAPQVTAGTRRGLVLCVVSGASFGLAAVVAKEAFSAGFNVPSMLAGRFGMAAIVFWLIVAVRSRAGLSAPRPLARLSGRALLTAIGLGAIGYALQSAFYFGALTRLDASVVAQLLYIYPALVLIIALVRRQESAEARKFIALLCSAAGLVLLLHGGGAAALPLPGVLMALGAAGTYALYITVAGSLPEDFDVYLLSAIVCSAATVSVGGYAAMTGNLHGPASSIGWFWLLIFAIVPTVVAIVTFLAGLRLVGGSVAAILSCVEPVVTVCSAALVYSERLTGVQILGGVAVLSSVIVLQARRSAGRVPPSQVV
ncbi:DMT family transporter [Jatrophihabitans sp. DSM 45814]